MEILVRPRVVPLFFQMTLCSMRTWDTCPWHVGGGLLTHHTSSGCRKASSDCPCFLSVKNCVKKHSNLSFLGQKNDFFSGEGSNPLHHTTPPSMPCPLLTEILNTPLVEPFQNHKTCTLVILLTLLSAETGS